MTKQILALFCFIRELNKYSPLTCPFPRARTQTLYFPLTFSPSPRANSNPILPPYPLPPPIHPRSSAHTSHTEHLKPIPPPTQPQPTFNPFVCPVMTVERMDV